MNTHRFTLLISLLLVVLTACQDDEGPNQNEIVNQWVYDTMDEAYYWTDQMPDDVNKNQDPFTFFKALKYSGDRFSAIVENYDELINSLNGIELEAGYEFGLVANGPTEVVAVVTYIKPNSPAAEEGLLRGDVITQINGQSMNRNNYIEVINQTGQDHTVTYSRYNESSQAFVEQSPLSLTAVQYSENPVYLDSVYTIDAKKIGYFVYNFFSDGEQNFDNEVDQVFQNFKSEGITDLVLDLRYNSGGSIVSATNLASQLAPNVTSSDVFYRNQWNDLYQNYWESQSGGEKQLTGYFSEESGNVGTEIGSNVYILTGSRTASASELVINGLDPYMNVTIIGDTTVGKNVGSLPFKDNENPDNTYGILPIVIRLANSQGYSDYSNGFRPLGDNLVNDFALPMAPLGSVDDPLLARALELITGTPVGGRKAGRMAKRSLHEVGSSLDRHLRSNKTVLDIDLPQ